MPDANLPTRPSSTLQKSTESSNATWTNSICSAQLVVSVSVPSDAYPGMALSIVVQDSDLGTSRGHTKIPVIITTKPGGDEETAHLVAGVQAKACS